MCNDLASEEAKFYIHFFNTNILFCINNMLNIKKNQQFQTILFVSIIILIIVMWCKKGEMEAFCGSCNKKKKGERFSLIENIRGGRGRGRGRGRGHANNASVD